MKVAVIGNTKQTYNGLTRLIRENYNVVLVFGLPHEKAINKVNFYPLENFCLEHDIIYDNSGKWKSLIDLDVELIICLGDSRIVPVEVINRHKVIGNHGAILPYVQGGASLVWGRMLNTGVWGISIMELEKTVDSGKILSTRQFFYNRNCSMQAFVDKADDATIEALFEYLNGKATESENSKWCIKITKKTSGF